MPAIAQRSCHSRPAGTLEAKQYSGSTKRYKSFFLNSVILAIKNKFSRLCSQETIAQHVFVSPHNMADGDKILAARNKALTVKIVSQPANCPDFIVLNLGFFFIHPVPSESNKCY